MVEQLRKRQTFFVFVYFFNMILSVMVFIIGFPWHVPSLASDYIMKVFVPAHLKTSFHIPVFFFFFHVHLSHFLLPFLILSVSLIHSIFSPTLPAFSHEQMPGSHSYFPKYSFLLLTIILFTRYMPDKVFHTH